MDLNSDQIKHIARIFDFLALAALAPLVAVITGLQEIPNYSWIQLLFFGLVAVILEILALKYLGKLE